ncbi:MAG: alpha/beta fold hydrolase [Planctomycetes bacterium]|nr:alpha/beta fold hydrolase [Planctomycetota bacterium]
MTTLQLNPASSSRSDPTERTFTTWDGVELFYRAWLPAAPAEKALVLFHRGHEHSGRFAELVERLGLEDFAVFAWDARGHGRSPGERGHAQDFSSLVRDAEAFMRHISEEYNIPEENRVVLGHSVGAVIAAAWALDYASPLRGLILGAPAFRVKLYVPLAIPLLRLLRRFKEKASIKSYVKATMLTGDPEEAEKYRKDPLISRAIAVNILVDLYDVSSRLIENAAAIHAPVLLLAAGSDWVVKNGAQRRFFERLSSPLKEMRVLPGFQHAIFHEHGRQLAFEKVREFIQKVFDRPAPAESPANAGQDGFTRAEFDRLSRPLSPLSPRRWRYAAQRLLMKTAGRLSDGIRLGWRAGFDSGQTLDYVYRDQAGGLTPLGKLFDRWYLDSIGWRGIRQRKRHLQEALREAILAARKTRGPDRPVQIVDLAAGPGRYLLEVLQEQGGSRPPVEALLRDRSPAALEEGRRLASALGLASATYAEGDAFDPDSLAALSPPPDIAIVSGLYELFPENDGVVKSLAGLSRAVPPGGTLIYTNQPWHPQQELIARVLTNRAGKPWIMRRRTQAEMDELVRRAGFEKLGMKIDRWGIFTVSAARRLPA